MKQSISILAVVLIALSVGVAMASSGEGEGHALPWSNYILRLVNFSIFIGIIWYLAGKKILAFFNDRRSQIKKDLNHLEVLQKKAYERFQNVEQSVANLELERKTLLDEARTQGEMLKATIIEKAHNDADQIKAQARISAEHEAKAAMDALRAQIAELIVEETIKTVREKLSDRDHERIVDEYLTKVVLN